jgi:AcrR family transcriptional regulator
MASDSTAGAEKRTGRAAKSSRAPTDAPAPAKRRRTYLPATERRKLILEAAQQVFARSNLQGARTRDIAKAAAVNQATLFEHFESKEALFHEAVVEPFLEAMQGMRERAKVYEAANGAAEIAELATASTERNLDIMVRIFPLFTAALFSDPELGRKLYCDHIAPLLADRAAAITGIVRESLDPRLVELATFGAFFAIAMDRHFKGGTEDISDIATQFTSLATGGFAKTKD